SSLRDFGCCLAAFPALEVLGYIQPSLRDWRGGLAVFPALEVLGYIQPSLRDWRDGLPVFPALEVLGYIRSSLRNTGNKGLTDARVCTCPALVGYAMARKRDNLILFGVDSLWADHMSCYGYHRLTTPHIDRLAGQSVLFERNYSPHVPTTSAYASMLTGMD